MEQIGIAAQVSRKTVNYYAWYEMYPSNAYEIPITVAPGNEISASVTYVGTNEYQLALSDLSTGQNYSILQTNSSGVRSSAEWIAEAPSSGGSILPLADFGTVNFTNSLATLNGSTSGSISAFSNTAINLVASSGFSATTSGLSANGGDFSVSVVSPTGGGGGGGHHGRQSTLITTTAAPEPSSLLLLGAAGLLPLAARRRRAS